MTVNCFSNAEKTWPNKKKDVKKQFDNDGRFVHVQKTSSTAASLSQNRTLVCRCGDTKTVEHFMLIVDADVFFTDDAFWTSCFTLLCESSQRKVDRLSHFRQQMHLLVAQVRANFCCGRVTSRWLK